MADEVLRAVVETAIKANAAMAADALATIQLGSDKDRLVFEGLQVSARIEGAPFEPYLVGLLETRGQLKPFAFALAARGILAGEDWDKALAEMVAKAAAGAANAEGEEDDSDQNDDPKSFVETHIDDDAFDAFRNRARSFRCQILVDGAVAGSGFLVGPSTVMTAWHVIKAIKVRKPKLEVKFLDERIIPAFVPPQFASECSQRELEQLFPKDDAEVNGLHDVALLTLKRPAGAHLGFARLSNSGATIKSRSSVILIHYPEGKYRGIGIGMFRKLRGLSNRWAHTVQSAGGSSGGGCFNTRFELAGVHQGRVPKAKGGGGRLVPVSGLPQEVHDLIARDEAPPTIWSLDGTVNGALVVGRQDFFHGFHAASQPASRVRGLHIKRVDAAADVTGIPFTYLMLEQLVARSLDARLVRISIETLLPDLADEIVRRAQAAGLDVAPIAPIDGVSAGQSAPEAVAADRGRRAASALDGWAGAHGLTIWVFLEHPSVVFGEALRSSFEAFVDQSLKLEHVRLVIAGYEAVGMPGMEFRSAAEARGDGPAGVVVEYISEFGFGDVEELVRQAAEGLGKVISKERVTELAEDALDGMPSVNGVYEQWRAAEVSDRLKAPLRRLAARGRAIGPAQAGEAVVG